MIGALRLHDQTIQVQGVKLTIKEQWVNNIEGQYLSSNIDDQGAECEISLKYINEEHAFYTLVLEVT